MTHTFDPDKASGAPQPGERTPNDQGRYEVKRADLPLYCPMDGMSLWNSHPRVFLPIEDSKDGTAKCPYCGADFILVD